MEIVIGLEYYIFYGIVFCSSFFLLWTFYQSKGLHLDVPNHRSMHERPTKKSAGLVFISIYILSLFYLIFSKTANIDDWKILFRTIPGITVCLIIGFLDDRHDLKSKTKLFIEVLFFIPYTYLFFSEFSFFGFSPAMPKIFYSIFLSGYFIFVINLCNFMDGLDLYLTVTILVAFFIFFSIFSSIPNTNSIIILLLGICLVPFIFYNFPPARLFMGDTGSLPLGYIIAMLPFLSGEATIELGYGFLLVPVFWVDGVFTIFRRILNKENIFRAHREHLYQRITLHSLDKRLTTLLFSFWNLSSIAVYFLLKDSFSLFTICFLVLGINGLIYFYLHYKIK